MPDLAGDGNKDAVMLAHLPKYRPDIDGLRAVAVIAVVIFHAAPRFLAGGFVGVDIFFVISGYLITTIIYEKLQRIPSVLRIFITGESGESSRRWRSCWSPVLSSDGFICCPMNTRCSASMRRPAPHSSRISHSGVRRGTSIRR
jgi:hypothetical protein